MTRSHPLGDRDEFMDIDYYDRWLESTDPDDVASTLDGVYDYIKMLEFQVGLLFSGPPLETVYAKLSDWLDL